MNIRKLRLAAKLTQQQVADTLQIARSAVAMWETSSRLPPSHLLPKLAALFGCTIDELFDTSDRPA